MKRYLGKWHSKQRARKLLERAAIHVFTLNLGVIRSTDNAGRIRIDYPTDPRWKNCVSVETMREGDKCWQVSHFSPARARLIAYLLLQYAKYLEEDNGKPVLDKRQDDSCP
jgi:hypothetical protein